MKYRDILGFSKKQPKKKVVKEQKKSSVVDNIKQELNEWSDTTFRSKPKRWSKPFGENLTEFEKEKVNEVGVAPQHKKFITKIDKAEQNLHKNIQLYKNFLISQGQKNAGMELSSKYVTNIGGFTHYLKTTWVKMIRKMI